MEKKVLAQEQITACRARIEKLKQWESWPASHWFDDDAFEQALNRIEQLQGWIVKIKQQIELCNGQTAFNMCEEALKADTGA